MKITGWGETKGVKYWEVVNSWGRNWGNYGSGKISWDHLYDNFIDQLEKEMDKKRQSNKDVIEIEKPLIWECEYQVTENIIVFATKTPAKINGLVPLFLYVLLFLDLTNRVQEQLMNTQDELGNFNIFSAGISSL